MALTLRPTPDEEKLIEDIKLITNEKSSSKAVIKSCEMLKVKLRELEETKSQLFKQRHRASKAEHVISDMQKSFDNFMNFKKDN